MPTFEKTGFSRRTGIRIAKITGFLDFGALVHRYKEEKKKEGKKMDFFPYFSKGGEKNGFFFPLFSKRGKEIQNLGDFFSRAMKKNTKTRKEFGI